MVRQQDLPDLPAEGIHPIRIPTPFAVGDVYSYLIKDEKIVLIDCGQKEDRAYDRVSSVLKRQGLAIRDIDEIWLTHGHPDHFGQAVRLADASGAVVLGHPKERANFGGNDDRDRFAAFFEYHAIPQPLIGMMVDQLDWLQQYQEALEPKWIEEGEVLISGNMSFEVEFTPGHAPGHLVFRATPGVIFGGDLLLEQISTNALINFDPDSGVRNKSLLQYRSSLKKIRGQNGLLLPGHGKVIKNISEVVQHHLSEHEERFASVKSQLSRRPWSLFELAREMFPEPMKKGAVFLVLSEVLGYLDWGMEAGIIEKREEGGRVVFAVMSRES